MLVHNGQSHRFTQGSNDFFQNWTIADAKKLFEQGLSDDPNLQQCKSKNRMDIEIPESWDFREEYPHCKAASTPTITQDCHASYVLSTLSAAEDRICKGGSGERVQLSSQELIDCDKFSECARGTVNKVLNWGKRRGFVAEHCYPSTGKQGECPEEHLEENDCRISNEFYRVVDFCIAQESDGIKREILTNGPVLGQLNPYTDMLTYKEGIYSRTQEAFRFQGNHVFKIIGWESSPDGGSSWIVENTWGDDWGEDGYAKIAASGETSLDFYAVSFAMYPKTVAELYADQELQAQMNQQQQFSQSFADDYSEYELSDDIEQIFLDDEEEIDPEL